MNGFPQDHPQPILPGKRILIAKNPNVPGLRPAAMRMALAGLLGLVIGLLVDFSYFPWPRQIALAAALAAFVGPVSFQLQKVGAGDCLGPLRGASSI